MLQTIIFLDDLTANGVNIRIQKYYIEEGQDPQSVGLMNREALQNSTRDRERLKEVLGEESHEYKAVMQMWGDEPTIVEPIQEPMTMPEEYENEEELPEGYEVAEEEEPQETLQ